MPITVLDHPLAGHLIAQLRDVETSPAAFRRISGILTSMLVVEATRSFPTISGTVTTPLMESKARLLAQPLAVVPILRAGLGMLEPVVAMFPDVSVGYVGLERHETTAVARSYYCKLPNLHGKFTLCLDPMLATGGSASQAIGLIKAAGAEVAVMVSVVAAPEGVSRMERDHPEVLVVVAAVDDGLDPRKFIVPGLGDFGDRLYGTG